MPRPRKDPNDCLTAALSLKLTPAMYQQVKSLAQIHDVSVNDFVISLLSKVIEQNRDVIVVFDAARNAARADVNLDCKVRGDDDA